jgi:hypothetical protein
MAGSAVDVGVSCTGRALGPGKQSSKPAQDLVLARCPFKNINVSMIFWGPTARTCEGVACPGLNDRSRTLEASVAVEWNLESCLERSCALLPPRS